MIRALRRIGIGLAALVAIGCFALVIGGPGLLKALQPGDGAGVAGVPIGGPFTLTDARTGARVTDANYRGQWMLVYFGYTFCPDVCPTDLQKMVAALTAMGPAADRITPIFITVDPARDNAAVLARYVGLFSPRLVGLTGSAAQVDAVTAAYRVYVQKVPPASPGAPYLVNHSAFMYLMSPKGKLAAIFPADATAQDLARQMAKDTATPAAS